MTAVANRTGRAVRNAGSAAIGQVLSTVFAFATRTVFIYTLGATYLGVTSLFTNVLAILSFAELGVGTAMTYALYGPLARNDRSQIAALMAAYAKAYRAIGLSVAVLGLAIMPFLGVLMKGRPSIPHLPAALCDLPQQLGAQLLHLLQPVTAHREPARHLDVLNRTGFACVQAVLQVGVLMTTHSFLAYLVIQTVCQVASNIAVTWQTQRMFPGVLFRRGTRLDAGVRATLVQNVQGDGLQQARFGRGLGEHLTVHLGVRGRRLGRPLLELPADHRHGQRGHRPGHRGRRSRRRET